MPLNQIFGCSVSVLCIVGSAFVPTLPAFANPRSNFPGRRISAGTRGECMSRVLAHLVPESSVMAMSPARDVALVLGPSSNPVPTKMSFKPAAGGRELVRTFQPESAGITLLTLAKTEAPILAIRI